MVTHVDLSRSGPLPGQSAAKSRARRVPHPATTIQDDDEGRRPPACPVSRPTVPASDERTAGRLDRDAGPVPGVTDRWHNRADRRTRPPATHSSADERTSDRAHQKCRGGRTRGWADSANGSLCPAVGQHAAAQQCHLRAAVGVDELAVSQPQPVSVALSWTSVRSTPNKVPFAAVSWSRTAVAASCGVTVGRSSAIVTSREWMTAWLSAPVVPPPGGCHACSLGDRSWSSRSASGSEASRAATRSARVRSCASRSLLTSAPGRGAEGAVRK